GSRHLSPQPSLFPLMDAQTEPQPVRLAVLAVTGLALILYSSTAAPGLTWAHHSADGGELLAAAATNGVPHPSGYPLYMILLRGWLRAGQTLTAATPARLGTMLSVLCAALSAGFTVATAAALLAPRRDAWRWAALAGIAWVTAPLVWSQ